MPVQANNFNTLRLLAALAVLWSHAFPLSTGRGTREPLMALSSGQTSLGTVAVAVFFVISGYLVTQSFVRSNSVWRFVKARVLRIMPGLLVALAMLGLLVGPLVTTMPLSEYFSSGTLYRFLTINGLLIGYYNTLPGVFADNPYPNTVDLPLWTLPFEAECYAGVLVLGILGLQNRYATMALFLCGLVYLVLDGPYTEAASQEQNRLVFLGTKFLAGAAIYHWRPKLNGGVALGCAGISTLALLFGGFWLALPTVFAYLVIYMALGPITLPDTARYGDLSYGIYIYGWPVKQLIMMSSLVSTWYWLGAIATLATVAVAFLSWHFIEKVALSFKDRMFPVERRLSKYLDNAVAIPQSWISYATGLLGPVLQRLTSRAGGFSAPRDSGQHPVAPQPVSVTEADLDARLGTIRERMGEAASDSAWKRAR
jgi:peptidoglycan/LPS O-acetylase OafA/YrhL